MRESSVKRVSSRIRSSGFSLKGQGIVPSYPTQEVANRADRRGRQQELESGRKRDALFGRIRGFLKGLLGHLPDQQ